jgi:hypothetical protein
VSAARSTMLPLMRPEHDGRIGVTKSWMVI